MRVLVVLTGGTIGSRVEGNVIDVRSDSCHIVQEYNRRYPNGIEFETVQPLNVLSENYTLETLQTLGSTLLSVDTSRYDGVVVTHGSDTLCYTAPFLGMLTRHFRIPVVMVASNYGLDRPDANGLDNFHGAISLIRSKKVRGCFVVWKDSTSHRTYVHLSTRLRECDSYTDNFQSFGGVPFAEVVDGGVAFYGGRVNPTLEDIDRDREPLCDSLSLDRRSLLVRAYTGLDYSAIDTTDVSSIVLYLYHSGTACTVGGRYSVLDFIDRNPGKSIYVASVKHLEDRYSTTEEILGRGVVPMYNVSPESAYVKSLLLSNVEGSDRGVLFFEEV